MKVLHETSRDNSSAAVLDMATIRRRVAGIKNRWTPEIAQARAAEGIRRRRELDSLLAELLLQNATDGIQEDASPCEEPQGFSLVG
jgi:hypothetical protein